MSALGASQAEFSGTEADLVDAAKDGDERAFGELYERYGRRIFAYVLGMVGDHGRAEDIAQDVFVSALRRMRSSDRAISFKPWIYEIAKNACIDEFRRVQRAREVSIEQGTGEYLVGATPSPDSCFEQRQNLNALHGAFGGLSERQHTVIVLRELEGLSYAEIAARTGMTLPMVESTLLRGRRRLSQEYDDIASGRRCEQALTVIAAGGQEAVNALGLREHRRFARHIVHCQPCARHARMAGISDPQRRVPRLVKKIAGLLPYPVARWSWPWGRHVRSGEHASRVLRSARRAGHFAHPGAAVGATPATVATMAAIVVAGGGAAVGLLVPDHATPTHGGPATMSAQPTAVAPAIRAAPPRKVSRQLGQPASASRTSARRSRPATRSGTAATTQNRQGAADGSSAQTTTSAGAPASAAAGAPATSTQPSAPSTPSSPISPSIHVPLPVPTVPALPKVTRLPHSLTGPVQKVVKTLPGPTLPGGLGLPNKTLGGLPNKTLGGLPNKALGGLPNKALGGVGGL